MYMHTQTHTHVHTYIHTYVRTYIHNTNIPTDIKHIHTITYTHAYIHPSIHKNREVHLNIYTTVLRIFVLVRILLRWTYLYELVYVHTVYSLRVHICCRPGLARFPAFRTLSASAGRAPPQCRHCRIRLTFLYFRFHRPFVPQNSCNWWNCSGNPTKSETCTRWQSPEIRAC